MQHERFALGARRHLAALVAAAALGGAAVAQAPGEVLWYQKISDTQGGFGGSLDGIDLFGAAIAAIGDVDGDGIGDLAVGASDDPDGGPGRGAVWILFLRANGTVRTQTKISDTAGGFTGTLATNARFGSSLAGLGDLDGDGVPDLAVGATEELVLGQGGEVWMLMLHANGTVKSSLRVGAGEGGFGGALDDQDQFGSGLASLGDLDGDGVVDLAVGARGDDDGGSSAGAVWVLFLNASGTVRSWQKISETSGGFGGDLGHSTFGRSVACMGDLTGDGLPELAVGAPYDTGGGFHVGAVWMLSLAADGTVQGEEKLGAGTGGFTGALDAQDRFGWSVTNVGDLDGDGVDDAAVGALHDDDGGTNRGATWILAMQANGRPKAHQKLSELDGGATPPLDDYDSFGFAVCGLGDHDGDGRADLAVAATGDDDGGSGHGAVWMLFLDGEPATPFTSYGCVSPAGSLSVLGGTGAAGSTVVLGVHNPLGTQAHGSLPLVVFSFAAAPGYPCGPPTAFGMHPAVPGELLVDLAPPNPVLVVPGPPWTGAPAPVSVAIPPGLADRSVYAQGVLLDPSSSSVRVALTEGLRIRVE